MKPEIFAGIRAGEESALEQAEQNYRELAECLPLVVYTSELGVKGRWHYVSPQLEQLLGFTPQEWMADPTLWSRQVHPDDRERQERPKEDAYAMGRPFESEYRIFTRDGREIWVCDSGHILMPQAGMTPIVQGVLVNVTERKQAEEARPYSKVLVSLTDSTERRRAEMEIQRQAETRMALFETTHDLVIERNSATLLHTIVKRAADLLHVASGGLYLCESEKRQVRCVVSYNTPRDYTGSVLAYGEGAAGRVAQTGEALIIEDYATWEGRSRRFERERPFGAVLSVPIKWQDQLMGVLHMLEYEKGRHFTQEDKEAAQAFANQAAIAIQNARLYETLERHNHVLSALHTSTLALIEELDQSRVLENIVAEAAQLVDTPHGYLYLAEPDEKFLEMKLGTGAFAPYVGTRLRAGEGLAGMIQQNGTAMFVDEYHKWEHRSMSFEQTPFYAVAGVPLKAGTKIIGVLGMAYREPDRKFLPEDLDVLNRFSTLASVALANARLYLLSQREVAERRQAEKKYRDIFESAVEGIYQTTYEGRYINANPALARMFGYASPDEMIASVNDLNVQFYVEPDRRRIFVRLMEEHGSVSGFESEIYRKDGSRMWISEKARAVRDDRGTLLYFEGFTEDITERKRAEQALAESEALYRQAIEVAGAVPYYESYYDNDTRIKYEFIGEGIRDITGYGPEEFTATLWDSLVLDIHPVKDLAGYSLDEAIRQVRSGEISIWQCEHRIRHRNGEVRWVFEAAVELRDEYGISHGSIGMYQDITERKLAEEKLRASEARYRALFENAPDGIFIADPDGSYIDVNQSGARMLGYTRAELTGMHISNVVLESEAPRVEPELAEVKASLPYQQEWQFKRKDGSVFTGEVVGALMPDGSLLGFGRDITERKQAENKLRESEARYRGLFENLVNGFALHEIVTDDQGQPVDYVFLEINPAFERLTGLEAQQVIGKRVTEALPGVENDHFIQIYGKVALTGEPVHIEEYSTPLGKYYEINAYSPKPRQFAVTFADITDRKQAELEVTRHLMELEALYDNGLAINRLLDPGEIGNRIIETFERYLSWHHVTIRLRREESDDLELVAFSTLHENEEQGDLVVRRFNALISKVGQGLSGWVMQVGTPLRTGNVHAYPQYADTYPGIMSGMYVPLKVGDRVIGVFSVESETADAFSAQDERLLATLANQAAVAMENARLYQSARQELVERKKAEEALREAEVRYRTLVDHIPAITYIGALDEAKTRLYVSPQIESMLGVAQAEYLKDSNLWREMLHPNDRPRVLAQSERLYAGGDPFVSEYRSRARDGRVLWFHDEAVIVRDEAGKPQYLQGVKFDITARKEAEQALEEERASLAQRVEERTAALSAANVNLARALRVKDEFLANMSHELRTPLNAILGLSESLGEQIAGPLNEKQQRYVATINESGHHLLSLINDILDLAKIEANQITLDIGKVNINTVCEASLRMIKQQAQKKKQEVALDIDSDIGVIWADERRLKQMVVNLLSNAVKFTPENGKLGLEVRGNHDENKAMFIVWDNGIGIEEGDLPRLFKPFVQLDAGLAREASGTGLGLALVTQMARLHGGSVSVESEPGRGSRFTIAIPWEPTLAADTVERLKITGKFRAVKPNDKNLPTILLVEDTREVIMTVRDYLEISGYKVVTAEDGVEGIEQAKLIRPDLILMDLQMPRMDGIEAAQRLRSEPDFKHTPIIALTALAMSGDRERCLAAGMDEYISKPVNLRALVKIIQNFLSFGED